MCAQSSPIFDCFHRLLIRQHSRSFHALNDLIATRQVFCASAHFQQCIIGRCTQSKLSILNRYTHGHDCRCLREMSEIGGLVVQMAVIHCLTCAGLQIESALHFREKPADCQPLRGFCLSIAAHKDRKCYIIRLQQGVCSARQDSVDQEQSATQAYTLPSYLNGQANSAQYHVCLQVDLLLGPSPNSSSKAACAICIWPLLAQASTRAVPSMGSG